MPGDSDELWYPEQAEHSWNDYLKDFNEQVLPTFVKAGFEKNTALTVWFLNKVNNMLNEMLTNGIPVPPDEEEGNGPSFKP